MKRMMFLVAVACLLASGVSFGHSSDTQQTAACMQVCNPADCDPQDCDPQDCDPCVMKTR